MSTEGIVVGAIVGVAVGAFSAVVANGAIRELLDKSHKEELEETRHAAFNEGWGAASTNANNVRQSYVRLFPEPEESKGTTLKASRKAA
jgi:gas vesicle protein